MTQAEILVIEDDALLNTILADSLQRMGYVARNASTLAEARHALNEIEPILAILDARLPDGEGVDFLELLSDTCPVIMMTAYGSVRNAVAAMKAGAEEYLLKPIDLDELEMVVQRALENRTLQEDFKFYKHQDKRRNRHNKLMVGGSSALHQVEDMIRAVAPTDVSVLIQGESGTGKELVASELHKYSQRSQRNFVALDCCTLQEKLFESELFGHERGAFTGADKQKKGLIESAEGGTLFLDEIGEIDATIQAKLLRILETGQFRRLGGLKDLHANVRIVAATNRDLEQMSGEGSFRNDLYYRLSTFIITLPPLRDRLEDIPALTQHFIANHSFSRRIDKQFNKASQKQLMAYNWPGNIRELRNVVERAIILSGESRSITPEHLAFCGSLKRHQTSVQLNFESEPNLEQIERDYFHMLMKKHAGHRVSIAKILGVSERNVYRMLKKYGAGE
ncbi:sigma-54-dependent transcriptional regulator [Candidatus Venteria ishoeyi]|uniref:Transcriptional regulatory protein ZraR n=1 Tax=Candidatus Venteria ishoeyi TaxID=1899563 RepID=A0A1H6FID8_9GAMM|nr:sigma-54 dependent transcriptional regulator [Candidatus Venteria ishoeyi]MDM8548105.1 sigma-54 dependent transcriptional regulator [Candidatus Venteria ishoeyi]SEH09191.1 Transcriptional regulatory protein ZraR [Candidatus Venteria ishoeyi]SEH09316.1 Transcriptional regulatory protein ZraR [Candidatus Venteria ishoeyi]